MLMRKVLMLSLFCAAVLALSCSDKKKADRQVQLKAMFQDFFSAPALPGTPEGLWAAESESVSALIEKKYLSSYVAKPDEKQADEIRERLKSLRIYFRIQKGNVQMLTIIADSFGVSAGTLTQRKPAAVDALVYDAVMRGKSSSLKAVFTLRKNKAGEKLEYAESGSVISAARETEKVDALVTRYLAQVNAATGLTQY